MHRLVSVVAVSGLLLLGAQTSIAAAPEPAGPPAPIAPAGKPLGIVPPHSQASKFSGNTSNLLYHSGGSVMTAKPQKEYAIYWGSDFSYNGLTTYQSIIDGYFSNVAADSGKQSNVYFSDTQYYQNISGTTYIPYSQAFTASYTDTNTPAAGCTSTAGGSTTCVTDAQIQAEVKSVIAAHGLPDGLGAEYFVFLANGWSTCSGSSCFISQFCAYHSHYDDALGQHVLYANMPFTGYKLSSCSGASGSPNSNAAADATINTVSHESNETITDPLGNAWFDRRGYENGDKCAYNYGTKIGVVNGGDYNQLIGSGKYELQQEWSNHSSGCVLTGT